MSRPSSDTRTMLSPAGLDLNQVAWLLIKVYGDRAAHVAADRADDLTAEGEGRAAAVFRHIAQIVRNMQRGRKPEEPMH